MWLFSNTTICILVSPDNCIKLDHTNTIKNADGKKDPQSYKTEYKTHIFWDSSLLNNDPRVISHSQKKTNW